MSFFTVITTNVRARRAAVVLYALVLFSLALFGHYGFSKGGPVDFFWVTVTLGAVALVVVAQVARGRLDRRLAWVSVWLLVANLAILALYLVVFWPQVRELTRP